MTALRTFFVDWTGHPRALAALLVALASAISLPSFATTLLVPENYSLEGALSAAASGDSISVAAYTLDGTLVDLTQSITLISREIGANRLIGVSVDSLQQVRVEGFLVGSTDYIGDTYEGGVTIRDSKVVFTDCEFSYLRTVSGPPIAYAADCELLFEGCTFHDNYWERITEGAASEGNCMATYNYSETDEGTLTIRDCDFQNQSSPVASWIPVTIENTRFSGCGPFLVSAHESLEMVGCLVANFQQYMSGDWLVVECLGVTDCIQAFGNVTIQGNTFVDTVIPPGPVIGPCGYGTVYPPEEIPASIKVSDSGSGVIENNLFIGLPAAAVEAPASVSVGCNDFWEIDGPNTRGGIGDVTKSDDNINAAPLFCARYAGDYTLSTHSPASAEHSSCGRMGAFDTACEITPVLVQDFTGTRVEHGVQLQWSLSEAQEVLLRRLEQGASAELYRGQGASGVYVDTAAPAGALRYGLGIVQNGQEIFPLETLSVVASEVPARTTLLGMFPNPFNPSTTIKYELDRTQAVTLRIFDRAGRLVTTLVDEQQVAGKHELEWRGTDREGRQLASGVYLCQLRAGSHSQSLRMVLLR